VDPSTILLALLTTLLDPWMAWCSVQLLQIQIRLARGEENFDRLSNQLDDHEARIRTIEASMRQGD
jgi:hypothetical protein